MCGLAENGGHVTRNRFLAALAGALGIARAQQKKQADKTAGKWDQGTFVTMPAYEAPQWMVVNSKALNNQCPVCGTMAEPFRCDPQYSITQTDVRLSGRDIVLLSAGKSSDKPPKMPSRLVRCARCNAAFWQDAEGGK